MDDLLNFGVWQLYVGAGFGIAGALWHVNRDRILEALTSCGISILMIWLAWMITDTLKGGL
jgi:hypothetical protein